MNLLDLTNKFITETGVTDTVQSLEDASDEVAQAVHWIAEAWVNFQVLKKWPFRWVEGSFTTTNGRVTYTNTETSRVKGDIIIPDSFYHDDGEITELSYKELRDIRRADAKASNTPDLSKITRIAVHEDDNGPIISTYPDVTDDKTIAYDYYRAAQRLTIDDADVEPLGLPSDYHMLIAHLAIADYGALEEGAEGRTLHNTHGKKYAVLRQAYENSLNL